MDRLLDRGTIEGLLLELGRRLETAGVHGRLFVVGGAAMTLAYGARRSTRDVDALFQPKEEVHEAARAIGVERGLPPDWLNDGVKGFLLGSDPDATVLLDVPGLRVEVASPRYLFVLKAMAARIERDADDLVALWPRCGFADVDEALDHVERHAPPGLLPPKTDLLLRELFG
ncbi:MAG: DUF6036 family nucleotidyltransferase [Actinomycetes bacterium]